MPRAFRGQDVLAHLGGGSKVSFQELEARTKLSRSCIRHTVTKLQEMGLVCLEEKEGKLSPTVVKMRDGVQAADAGIKISGVFNGNQSCLSRVTREALGEGRIAGSLAVMHRLCGSNLTHSFDLV